MSPAPAPVRSSSPWDALRYRVFRALWIATVVANIGTWMQSAAAGWLMTSLDPQPLIVALVQLATALPMFLSPYPPARSPISSTGGACCSAYRSPRQ